MPVTISCPEVRGGKAGVGPEYFVDKTDALEKFRPVEGGNQAHASDHVAHRDIHRCLPLVLEPDNLICRCALSSQMFFEPAQSRHDHRVLIAQPLDQLDCERRRQRAALELPQDRRRLN